MNAKHTHKKSTLRKPSTPYEVISAISVKLSGDLSESKLKSAITLTAKKTESVQSGIYSEVASPTNKDQRILKILFCSDDNQKELKKDTFGKLNTPNNVILIPSDTSSTGIFLEVKNHTDFKIKNHTNIKNINSKDRIIIEDSWLNKLSNIVVNSYLTLQDQINHENKINKLNKSLNASSSIYSSWDQKNGWAFQNIRSLTKIGYSKKHINVSILEENNPIFEEDWKKLYVLFQKCITQGVDYDNEFRSIAADKKQHWYRGKVIATEKNSDGSARQVTSVSEDITAIKKSEKLLVESAKNEKWLVDHTNVIFNSTDYSSFKWVLSELAEYLQADRCIIRLLDQNTFKSNVIAEYCLPSLKPISEIFPEIDVKKGIDFIKKSNRSEKTKITEDISAQVKDKKILDFHKTINVNSQVAHPIYFEKEVVGYLSAMTSTKRKWKKQEIRTIQVITETVNMAIIRNRLLNELKAIDDRYELAMQSSTYGIWDYDVTKKTLFISPHYFEKLGYKPNEVESTNRFIASITHPEDKQILQDRGYLYFSKNHSANEVEIRQRKKSGEDVWILSRGKVVKRDKKGNPLRITGINTEIGAQKKAQKDLEIIRKKSVEENKQKSEFLERMSHEIRTPMNAITGMTYLVKDTKLSDEQKNHINNIDSAAQSLLGIIDDILDFSKIEAGELAIINQPFSLKRELDKIIKLMSLRATQRNNTLELKISEDFPAEVIGDANRLRQILLNLLSNAIKFTENGNVSVLAQIAEINSSNKTCSILFSISDSGIGLNEDQLETIFTPFMQAEESTTRHYGGTGLGLSICKNLIEMMGGSIQAISIPNVGTTFHFTINFGTNVNLSTTEHPASSLKTKIPNSHKESSIFKTGSTYETLQGKHILLVEDNIVNQKVAKGILTKFGLITMQANNGKEALDILESIPVNTFDAILMDIEMPVLNGLSTTKTIRQSRHWNQVPIIAMTAHAMVGDKERYLEAGMNAYIPKPVDPKRLIETIMSAINCSTAK